MQTFWLEWWNIWTQFQSVLDSISNDSIVIFAARLYGSSDQDPLVAHTLDMCKALGDSVPRARLHMFVTCQYQHPIFDIFKTVLGGQLVQFDCSLRVPLESSWYIWSYSANQCSSAALKDLCKHPYDTQHIFLPEWSPAAKEPLFRLSTRQAGSHAHCSAPVDMDADCCAEWLNDARSGPPEDWCRKNMVVRMQAIRRLCTCEEEALIGMPMDFTDAISRVHAEELNIRECRRNSVVASCTPFTCAHMLFMSEIGNFEEPSVQYLAPIDQLEDTYSSIFDECPYNIHYKATHGHRQASCGPETPNSIPTKGPSLR